MANAQILLVEDECIVAKGIQHDLRNMGYDVPVIASSAEEAIEKAAETYPDLVLMDIVLKGSMDGIEATRKMRDRFDIPVVYLTAYEDDETLKRARLTEPFGYLLKPYEEKELHTTIQIALYKHRMERKLKETEQWLTATLKSISDGVIATDARQCIKFINPVAESLTGWSRGAACGQALSDVFQFLNESTFTLIEGASRQAFKKGAPADLPPASILLARDGRQTPVEGAVSAILDEDGFFAGFVWVFRDVSERLRAEEERRSSDEQLRQLQKMEAVTRLAGGVAHDFNNLLTVILGNTSLVLSSLAATDTNYDSVVAVETAAVRASELVKQLLGFSGKAHLWLEPVNLNTAIHQMVEVLRGIVDPKIAIDFQAAPDLWTVEADPAQIDEVLMSLCLNARDAMPQGGQLRLTTENVALDAGAVKAHRQAQPGDYVHVSIQDNGPGIPAELRGRIFEPFVTSKEFGMGLGLGLSLAYGTVDQHRGWIECHSDPGQGTRFDIYLPCRRQGAPTAAPSPPVRTARSGAATILLVDDEPMIREFGQTILQGQGYHVLLADDGVQAVETYRREKDHIDLVILDLTMPRMSGCDAFQQLLQIDPNVHVLFSSGYFAEDLTAEDDRILGFITKPYRHDDLANIVRAALEQVRDDRKK